VPYSPQDHQHQRWDNKFIEKLKLASEKFPNDTGVAWTYAAPRKFSKLAEIAVELNSFPKQSPDDGVSCGVLICVYAWLIVRNYSFKSAQNLITVALCNIARKNIFYLLWQETKTP